jgi:hypothetical protein
MKKIAVDCYNQFVTQCFVNGYGASLTVLCLGSSSLVSFCGCRTLLSPVEEIDADGKRQITYQVAKANHLYII